MKHPPRNIDLTCFNWVKLVLKTNLPANAKYIGLYLSTYMNLNQDMAFPSLKRIEAETSLSHPSVLKYIGVLVDEGWLAKQSGDRVTSNRYWINIPQKVVDCVGNLGVGKGVTYVTSEEKVGKEVTSNNNIITKNTHKRFKPPTPKEVDQYAQEKNLTIDPERFCDFYESKGWMVGKNKMKSWQAAARNWNKGKSNGQAKQNTINGRKLSGAERTRLARQRAYERQSAAESSNMGCVEPD